MSVRRSALIGGCALVLALAILLATQSEPRPPFPRELAVTAARSEQVVADFLARNPPTKAVVIPLDNRLWRVTFQNGPHVLLDAAVNPAGDVVAVQTSPPGVHRMGSSVLLSPIALILFASLFVAVVAVRDRRSLRNVDAIVVASGFTGAVALYDARLPAAEIYVATATLAYVAARCAVIGLRPETTIAARRRPAVRSLLGAPEARRLLTFATFVAAAAGVIVTVTSTGATDVAFASLSGATLLADGVLPYDNLTTDLVHGDTYPLLAYLWYVPAVLVSPTRDAFDSLDGALVVCAFALLATAWLLSRLPQDAGQRRIYALAWLTFPPVVLAASTGGNDAVVATLLALALVIYPHPRASALVLGLAAWTKVVPGLALLFWARRGYVRGQVAVVLVVSAAVMAGLLALGGWDGLRASWDALRFQSQRGSWYSIWRQTGALDVQPVFQAATIGLAAFAAAEVWRRGRRGLDLRRAAALAAAVIALVQIAANYWTFTYVAWLMPLVVVALFPPLPQRSPRPSPSAP